MTAGYFITGTDTGVGKTIVTGALAAVLRSRGTDVGVMKPVATGCERRREGLVSPDAEFLAKVADAPEPLEAISPVRFAEPLAPTVAAARAGREVDLHPVWTSWHRLRRAHDIMLIEGIGGALCPVTPRQTAADLARRFNLPVLVVARPGLGTINHTAMTVEVLRSRRLAVAGVVINRYNRDTEDVAELTNPDEIQRVTGAPVLGLVPEDRRTDFRAGVLGEDVLAAVRQMTFPDAATV
ncbi:MAG: dethiobiotin synthase [Phycisphaerae bacterium]